VTGLALGLVLASALVHASWNYLLKKSGGGAGLITAASALSLVVYAPLVAAVLWFQRGYAFEPVHLALMAGSGLVHTAYFLFLDRAYRSGGDLSIVYPLARATGPLLSTLGSGSTAWGSLSECMAALMLWRRMSSRSPRWRVTNAPSSAGVANKDSAAIARSSSVWSSAAVS